MLRTYFPPLTAQPRRIAYRVMVLAAIVLVYLEEFSLDRPGKNCLPVNDEVELRILGWDSLSNAHCRMSPETITDFLCTEVYRGLFHGFAQALVGIRRIMFAELPNELHMRPGIKTQET